MGMSALDHYATQARIAELEAEVARLKPDAERYRWLRDGKSDYAGWGGSAPYVISPSRSVLYAIHALRAAALDADVDADIFHTKANGLHRANEVAERGLLPEGASRHDSEGPYVDALYKLTQEALGWDDERAALAASKGA